MSSPDQSSILAELKVLGELKADGVLSDAEFQIEKEKLLSTLNASVGANSEEVVEADVTSITSFDDDDSGSVEEVKKSTTAKSVALGGVRAVGAVYTLGASEFLLRKRRKLKAMEAELENLKKQNDEDDSVES